MRAEAEDLLDSATDDAHARGIDAAYAIVEGRPVDAILAAPAARKASLIVIGTHGRRGLARLFVGSTTEGVLYATEIPALVVRPGVRASMRDHGTTSRTAAVPTLANRCTPRG